MAQVYIIVKALQSVVQTAA